MRRSRSVGILAVTAAAATMVIGGCSQVAQLQPVAGDGVTSVRIATNDVLTAQKVPIQQVPICTYQGTNYSCAGTTTSGQKITSTAKTVSATEAVAQYPELAAELENTETKEFIIMEVKVGPRVLYTGPTATVLNKAGQVGS